jgi:hypothetical protein
MKKLSAKERRAELQIIHEMFMKMYGQDLIDRENAYAARFASVTDFSPRPEPKPTDWEGYMLDALYEDFEPYSREAVVEAIAYDEDLIGGSEEIIVYCW